MQVLALETKIGSLLIPVSMIAQILSKGESNDIEHNESFVRNKITWREYELPLVFSSEMLGGATNSDSGYVRSVILWPIQGTDKTDLFALTSLDSPKVLDLESDIAIIDNNVVSSLCENGELKNCLSLVALDQTVGIIPDLIGLSSKLFLPAGN